MKWGSGKDSFVDSARFTKWRGTRYVYIYIYTEEKGKSWGVEANDINYSQSPGLKYPKNSRICSWTEAALVGPDTKCLCLNKGFYPSLPLRLWQIRLRVRDPSTLLLFLFSLSLPLRPYRAIWNFYPAYLRARWKQGEGRGASQSSRLFFVRYREQVEILNERARWMLLLYFYRYFYRWVDWSCLGHDSKETIDGTRGVHCPS